MDRWFVQTVSDLARHEGFREYAYPDPLSRLGVKYGARKYRWGYRPGDELLELYKENERDGRPWTIGFGFTRGTSPTSHMTYEQALKQLSVELVLHLPVLDRLVPTWERYPEFAKTVLANLAFNLGYDRLKQFHGTLKAFNEEDWDKAAKGLRNSLWYKQVGLRARELVERLEKQKIQPEYAVPDFSGVTSTVTSTATMVAPYDESEN